MEITHQFSNLLLAEGTILHKNDIRDVGSTADLVLVFLVQLVHLVLVHQVHLILMILMFLMFVLDGVLDGCS